MKLTWLQRIAIRRILGREWVEPVEKFLSLFDSPGRAMASFGGRSSTVDEPWQDRPRNADGSVTMTREEMYGHTHYLGPDDTDSQGRALPASDVTTTRVPTDVIDGVSRQMGFGPIPSNAYVGPDTKDIPNVVVGKVTDTGKIAIGKPPADPGDAK